MTGSNNKNTGVMHKYSYLLNAVNQLSEGMVIVNAHNRIELCNQQIYKIFPYLDHQLLIGIKAFELVSQILAVEFKSDERKIIAIKRWYKRKLKANTLINFSFTSQSGFTLEYRDRFTDDNERICLLLDETNITQLHDKLEKTWLKSVEVSAAKSQFMAAMGHEIRTPLNAIIGLLELTLRDERYQDNKHLQVASRSANHLLNLLNDVLDYTKFEADKVNLSTVDVDLRLLCEDVLSTFAVQAQQRGVWLELYVDPKLEKLLHYDDVRITQILHNLISNAIKFNTSETPSVLLKLEALSSTATSQTLKFSVCDNGIGLTAEQQHKIFQGFMQADDETFRKFGGTGLGLNICQKICHLMHSELKVESEVNHGATFYFIVKIPFTNSQKTQVSQKNPLKGLSRADLNIFTNHPKLSYTLQRYADAIGFNLHYVSSYSLLELNEPDAVILFDPHQADLKFCNSQLKDKNLFQHLLSMPQRKALLIQDGDFSANQTNIKQISLMPLRLEQLLELVKDTSNGNNKLDTKRQGDQNNLNRINALVVEDNADNIFVLEHQLASIGVQATFCDDPEKAIIQFQQHNYNLIISDYQMPHLTGAELTQTIRYIEETEFRIPTQVIVLTADKSSECQQACSKAQVNQIFIKPLSLPVLQKYLCDLNLFLEEHQEQDDPLNNLDGLEHDFTDRDDIFIDTFNDDEEQVNEYLIDSQESRVNKSPVIHPLNSQSTTQEQPAPMDIKVIYKFVGDISDEEIDDFLTQFLGNLEQRHQALQQAFMDHDFNSVHSSVHTIKSSALYIGAQALSDACQKLENNTGNNQVDLVEAHQLWQHVEREIERLLAYLVARKGQYGKK
ncbi:ATP-binding response regulator [Shewanella sp.]|uniref:ATP-binding response regulator n=2 Tax=Shewanella sp. TaxID=50422 RepID=UPI0040544AB3